MLSCGRKKETRKSRKKNGKKELECTEIRIQCLRLYGNGGRYSLTICTVDYLVDIHQKVMGLCLIWTERQTLQTVFTDEHSGFSGRGVLTKCELVNKRSLIQMKQVDGNLGYYCMQAVGARRKRKIREILN